MAALKRDSLAGLELLRLQLEENVQKLNKALRHWQTWEAEYEGLKEELCSLPPDASEADLVQLGSDYGGDLVTEKEIRELFGQDKGAVRDSPQIIRLIDRRIDYVQKNVESLKKQYESAESKLESIAVVRQPEARNEEGLPIKDIYEELDEDGNVISSSIREPGNAEPQILEALQKAGLKNQDIPDGREFHETEQSNSGSQNKDDSKSILESSSNVEPRNNLPHDAQPPLPDGTKSQKKLESFSSTTKDDPSPATSEPKPSKTTPHNTPSSNLTDLTRGTFAEGDRVIELDDEEKPLGATAPRIPIDESPEDARLRRQMLEYHLREVGDIVAELNLDEEGEDSQASYSDLDDMEDEDDDGEYEVDDGASTTGSTDDEDQYGMSHNGVMSEAYKKEMLELEAKLRARAFQNVGPNPDLNDVGIPPTEQQHPTEDLPKEPTTTALSESKASQGKTVRFAKELDVAPTQTQTQTLPPEPSPLPTQSTARAVKDTIVERKPAPQSTDTTPQKQSRFKEARRQQTSIPQEAQPAPHRSAKNPLAPQIIERPSKISASAADGLATAPSEPDEFDPNIQRQQVIDEYYQKRNRLVQREGGFSRQRQEEEEEKEGEGEVSDDDGEIPRKRVSLFKAARVKGFDGRR